MPRTLDVGPFFVHGVRLRPRTSVIHRAPTLEIEAPYRASKSVVLRLFRWGLVFGRWRDTGWDEKDALLYATQGTENVMSTKDIRDQAHRFDRDVDDALLT